MNSAVAAPDLYDRQYSRVEERWGNAIPMIVDVRRKEQYAIEDWMNVLRRKTVEMTERGNGDGFWEARADWYSRRAAWLEKFLQTETFMKTPVSPKRSATEMMTSPSSAIRPMSTLPIKKRIMNDRSVVEVTDGGWPSTQSCTETGPTLSGQPIGENKGGSGETVTHSHSPSPKAELDSVSLN